MLELEVVYGWLNRHKGYESFLSVPVRRLIDLMKTALENGQLNKTINYINLAVDVCQSLGNTLEIGETRVECAYAYIQMNMLPESIGFLRRAATLFNAENIHNQAIALWMLGYVFWETNKQSDAIIMWERSCRIFRELQLMHVETDWYANASEQMCKTLSDAIDQI
jgi:tetratricopeptide (TPR) repeat protein